MDILTTHKREISILKITEWIYLLHTRGKSVYYRLQSGYTYYTQEGNQYTIDYRVDILTTHKTQSENTKLHDTVNTGEQQLLYNKNNERVVY